MSDNTATPAAPAPWSPPDPLPRELHTERLTLRFPEPRDAEQFHTVIDGCRETLMPWLPWAPIAHKTVEQSTAWIDDCRATRETKPGTDYVLAVFERSTGRLLGGTGLHRIVAAAHEAEIGYWVRADERARGICTEATRALIRWAFTPQDSDGSRATGWGLRRLHIRCAGRNLASQRVPRKLGLREEARFVKDRWVPGIGWDDTLAWGVLNDEWEMR